MFEIEWDGGSFRPILGYITTKWRFAVTKPGLYSGQSLGLLRAKLGFKRAKDSLLEAKNARFSGINVDKAGPQKCNQLSLKQLQNGPYFENLRPTMRLGSKTRISEAGL